MYTRTSTQLHIIAGDAPAPRDPDFGTSPNFTVAAADGSLLLHMRGTACQLHVTLPGAYLYAECTGSPMLWDAGGFGPEGAWGLGRARI